MAARSHADETVTADCAGRIRPASKCGSNERDKNVLNLLQWDLERKAGHGTAVWTLHIMQLEVFVSLKCRMNAGSAL